MSVSHEKLLLLKNATVNWNLGFDNVCKEKHVVVAYNNEPCCFQVSNITGEMVKWPPVYPIVRYVNIAWEWEINEAFFEINNIKPTWLNCNYTWGWLDDVTNTWTGAVGTIERDEADLAVSDFAITYERSKVSALALVCYRPIHWLTRYPLELPPTWNLLGLFTKV